LQDYLGEALDAPEQGQICSDLRGRREDQLGRLEGRKQIKPTHGHVSSTTEAQTENSSPFSNNKCILIPYLDVLGFVKLITSII